MGSAEADEQLAASPETTSTADPPTTTAAPFTCPSTGQPAVQAPDGDYLCSGERPVPQDPAAALPDYATPGGELICDGAIANDAHYQACLEQSSP